jgi:hypothetical protein
VQLSELLLRNINLERADGCGFGGDGHKRRSLVR